MTPEDIRQLRASLDQSMKEIRERQEQLWQRTNEINEEIDKLIAECRHPELRIVVPPHSRYELEVCDDCGMKQTRKKA